MSCGDHRFVLSDPVLHWRGDVILTRDIELPSERSEFYARVKGGEFVALFRGAYVRGELWRRSSPDDRYLLRLDAAREILPGSIFSHQSAAAVWGLPIVGDWPRRAHVLQPIASGDRSTTTFIRHSVDRAPETVQIGKHSVTPLNRTVIDVASTSLLGVGVTMADAAIRRTDHPVAGFPRTSVTKQDLRDMADALGSRHGAARARRVVEFADGAADRPGESMSRVAMHIARITPPLLQVVLYGQSGKRYVVDFWWPQFNVIGEFDGWAKYSDPEFLRGRTPDQAFRDEKRREDDLRAAGHGMTRWEWAHALDPALLRARLLKAGVR